MSTETIQEIEKEALESIEKARSITVRTQEQYEEAAVLLKLVKERQKKVKESFDPIVDKAHKAHKEAVAQRDKLLNPLLNAEKDYKRLMINYDNQKEAEAKAEQDRLQKLADAEAAKQKKILDEKIARAEASGKLEKAEAFQAQKETIIPIQAPVIAAQINNPSGVSYRDNWSAEVIDVNLLPSEYMLPNLPMLNAIAKSTKGSIKISGVKFNCEKVLSSRG